MGVIEGVYNPPLVLLSVAIAIVGAFASLQVARHIHSRREDRVFWTCLAGFTFGGGATWSMHFIGMLAFNLGMPVRYGLLLTALSLVVAVVMSALGFWVVANGSPTPHRCLLGGGHHGTRDRRNAHDRNGRHAHSG